MTPIANPKNNFVPNAGDFVRILGACHPRLVGKIARIRSVDADGANTEFSEGPTFTSGELVYSGGELGGLEFVASEQDVRNKAYILWEQDGGQKPSEDYWEEAVWQLSTDKWKVSSGDLQVEGEGPFDKVVDTALMFANNQNIFLGETVTLSDCVGRSRTVATLPMLKKLGLAY